MGQAGVTEFPPPCTTGGAPLRTTAALHSAPPRRPASDNGAEIDRFPYLGGTDVGDVRDRRTGAAPAVAA